MRHHSRDTESNNSQWTIVHHPSINPTSLEIPTPDPPHLLHPPTNPHPHSREDYNDFEERKKRYSSRNRVRKNVEKSLRVGLASKKKNSKVQIAQKIARIQRKYQKLLLTDSKMAQKAPPTQPPAPTSNPKLDAMQLLSTLTDSQSLFDSLLHQPSSKTHLKPYHKAQRSRVRSTDKIFNLAQASRPRILGAKSKGI